MASNSVYHPFDGGRDDRRGVVGEDHLHTGREERLESGNGLAHRLGGVQGVGAGSQANRQTGGRHAVELCIDGVVLAAQFDPGDVAQTYLGAVRLHLEQNLAELVRSLQAGLADDGGVELVARCCRQAAELAGGNLHVLRLNGAAHVHRGQLEAVELGRVEPDTHCVLRAEHLEVADTLGPRDRVLHVGDDVVGQVLTGQAAVFRHHADDHEEVAHRLGHADALLLHFLRQQGGGQLQLVLHLNLGDIRVNPLFEGNDDLHAAVGVARRTDIAQAVEAVELLFDHLHYGVLHRLRRGARVADLNGDGRRRDARILVDRQLEHGQAAGQHDHQGDHPGKDRPVDKESGHSVLLR
jgi:hypothetical protein